MESILPELNLAPRGGYTKICPANPPVKRLKDEEGQPARNFTGPMQPLARFIALLKEFAL
ncbi:MAG: hypothetical protein WBV28_17410 [Terracidiphilus sp.]